MQDMKPDGRYIQAVGQLPDSLSRILLKIPPEISGQVQEIRMGAGRPLALWTGREILFVSSDGRTSTRAEQSSKRVTQREIWQAVETLSGHSVHSHQEEMRQGFLTAAGGHRAGLAGTAVYHDGELTSVREISAVNLRIARQIKGCAAALLKQVFGRGYCSFLLAGPPSSGKTTLLRDIARQLSGGESGAVCKTTVVDERGEIAACVNGIPQNDLGYCCDVLSGYGKAEGILQAVRTLSPQFVLCDEIGTAAEAQAVTQSFNSGVHIIATLHAGGFREFCSRTQGKMLMQTGVFSKLVVLSGERTGVVKEIIDMDRQVGICSKR